MADLFPTSRLRTKNGRYATREQVISERNADAATYWRMQAEIYRRQADALAKSVALLERQLSQIRTTLSTINF
jgi:hypothetical protein